MLLLVVPASLLPRINQCLPCFANRPYANGAINLLTIVKWMFDWQRIHHYVAIVEIVRELIVAYSWDLLHNGKREQ